VKGKATSCWNTTCPSGTECVSKDLLLLRNPQCKATMVDRNWCGWFGTACASNKDCTFGVCTPKFNTPCDLSCAAGKSCCWVNGVKSCVDVTSNSLSCGACGNACNLGELCGGGKCKPWFSVANVCPGTDNVNCSTTGIGCKNITNDPKNCGGCGIPCPDEGWCQDGVCTVMSQEVQDVD
jgi:hypothetical protein